MDRLPRPRLRVLRRRDADLGARQPEGRRHAREQVRPRSQPDVRRPRAALRGGGDPGAPAPAARQGEGRGRRCSSPSGGSSPCCGTAPSTRSRSCGRRWPSCSTKLNDRPMRRLKKSRRQLFEEIERAALKPLPVRPYELAEWSRPKVASDYHVEYDDHFYSVHFGADRPAARPARHRGDDRDLPPREAAGRATRAATRRGSTRPRTSTCRAPTAITQSGRPSGLRAGQGRPGPKTVALVEAIMASKVAPGAGLHARASGSSGSASSTRPSGSSAPARGRCTSGRSRTRASPRS